MKALLMTRKRALLYSYYVPQENVDSFSRRLFHFVEFLREDGWTVTCVAKEKGIEQSIEVLKSLDVPVHIGGEEQITRLAGQESFDVAILGFWYMAEPVLKVLRQHSPTTRVIVDSGDLHFLRHARRILGESAFGEGFQMPDSYYASALDDRYAAETVRELNAYAAANAVFAVSRKEADFVNDFVGNSSHAYVVPDSEELTPSSIPFLQRRGMLFVGNFQHLPNVEAVDFLCGEVLRQFDPALLADHPVYIIGNAMPAAVRAWGKDLPFVRMVGWVPSVVPYLEQVRISLIPLLHGAGTKRKMIQALAIGTPTVSTRVGAEGFDLRDGQELLIADDPVAFANATARLLRDGDLWERIARQGRDRILTDHSRETARARLLEAIASVLARAKRPNLTRARSISSNRMSHREYQQIVRRTREIVSKTVPARSTVIVVSKGDDALLNLGDRAAWHFPQESDGVYAGHHPANSEEAIAQLEALRSKGADFLVFPKTALWWLDHYADFKQHLERSYRREVNEANSCIVFSLRQRPLPDAVDLSQSIQALAFDEKREFDQGTVNNGQALLSVEARRPLVSLQSGLEPRANGATENKILVVGVYLAARFNNIDDTVRILSESTTCEVVQRWAALGGAAPTQRVAEVTVQKVVGKKPKFEILNELLLAEKVSDFEYVIVCDDDIVLPEKFADHFVALQSSIGFSIAQPALTSDSHINHPITERQRGATARETRFVEIGPLVSFHRSVYPLVFPFDLTSPMGWGYEHVWAARLAHAGKRMGIIDAVSVDHGLRESVSNYSWEEANHQRATLLAKQQGHLVEDPFRVLSVASHNTTDGNSRGVVQRTGRDNEKPLISVVIPTHNRAPLLEQSLRSLSGQSLPGRDFEVIVVDDGSTDATAEVCERWFSRIPLIYLYIQRSGIAAAKNLGVFAASSPIILFFDDDDIADENLLTEHLKMHARYPLENVTVLGYTEWAPSLEISRVMHYVANIGHYLFSYTNLVDDQRLDFTYFWGGRSSCKKSLLTGTGVFRQEFEFGSEDIELGFRIAKRLVEWRLLHRPFTVDQHDEELKHRLATIGLPVIFNRNAIQYMNRPITYEEFCRRCERQGRSQFQFSQLYDDSIIHEWCQTPNALERWQQIRSSLPVRIARVHEIEAILQASTDPEEQRTLLSELHRLYGWTFDTFKTKGIIEAARATSQTDNTGVVGTAPRARTSRVQPIHTSSW